MTKEYLSNYSKAMAEKKICKEKLDKYMAIIKKFIFVALSFLLTGVILDSSWFMSNSLYFVATVIYSYLFILALMCFKYEFKIKKINKEFPMRFETDL